MTTNPNIFSYYSQIVNDYYSCDIQDDRPLEYINNIDDMNITDLSEIDLNIISSDKNIDFNVSSKDEQLNHRYFIVTNINIIDEIIIEEMDKYQNKYGYMFRKYIKKKIDPPLIYEDEYSLFKNNYDIERFSKIQENKNPKIEEYIKPKKIIKKKKKSKR